MRWLAYARKPIGGAAGNRYCGFVRGGAALIALSRRNVGGGRRRPK